MIAPDGLDQPADEDQRNDDGEVNPRETRETTVFMNSSRRHADQNLSNRGNPSGRRVNVDRFSEHGPRNAFEVHRQQAPHSCKRLLFDVNEMRRRLSDLEQAHVRRDDLQQLNYGVENLYVGMTDMAETIAQVSSRQNQVDAILARIKKIKEMKKQDKADIARLGFSRKRDGAARDCGKQTDRTEGGNDPSATRRRDEPPSDRDRDRNSDRDRGRKR